MIDPLKVSTNYYKLAHISEISFTIFTANSTGSSSEGGTALNDQSLLELELTIRHNNPDVLLTYYNKCLYYFNFEHINQHHTQESLAQFQKEYPSLHLKFSSVASVEVLTNPPKPTPASLNPNINSNSNSPAGTGTGAGNNSTAGTAAERNAYLPFISLTFLKALKKLILYKLSKAENLQLFGNYAVVSCDKIDMKRYIVHIDPVLLPNGDLLVCITQRNNATLFQSKILMDKDDTQLNSKHFAIYIIPSGIRCHLYYPEEPNHSFTYTPPNNSDAIINLIKLSTGLDLSNKGDGEDDKILWVKLIPNLQHLNNQTSKISKFIHPVDNRKFILWPWKLCLVQFGYSQDLKAHEFDDNINDVSTDPFQLISELMDFSISQNMVMHPNIQQQHSSGLHHLRSTEMVPSTVDYMPSVGSGLEQVAGNQPQAPEQEHELKEEAVGEQEGINIDLGVHQAVAENNISTLGASQSNEILIENADISLQPKNIEDDDEMDDLFGGESDDGQIEDDVGEGNSPKEEKKTDQPSINEEEEIDIKESDFDITNDDFAVIEKEELEGYDTKEEVKNSEHINDEVITDECQEDIVKEEDSNDSKSNSTISTYLDIPKDQMTIPIKNFTKQSKTPYNDPGAPPPLMATPFIQPMSTFGAPPPPPPSTAALPSISDGEETSSKSIFSPLHFNPIIKSNIDKKYGRGGKFFVEKESKNGTDDTKKKSMRATSVVGYERYERENSHGSSISSESKLDPIIDGSGNGAVGNSSIRDILELEDNIDDFDYNNSMNEDIESDEDEDIEIASKGRSPLLKLNNLPESQLKIKAASVPLASKQNSITSNSMYYNNLDYSSPTSNTSAFPQLANAKLESPFGNINALGISTASVLSSRGNNASLSPVDLNPYASFVKELSDDERSNEDDVEIIEIDDENNDTKGNSDTTSPTANFVGGENAVDVGTEADSVNARGSLARPTSVPLSNSNTPPISSSNSMSEASNCLPLILRCINVCTIPDVFFLNNLKDWAPPVVSTTFMYVDDEVDSWDDGDELKSSQSMSVKLSDIDDFLHWLTPSLVFDMGMNLEHMHSTVKLNLPSTDSQEISSHPLMDGKSIGFENDFEKMFPLCYRVSLSELLQDMKDDKDNVTEDNEKNQKKANDDSDANMDLENQLSFLDDITNDIMLNPKAQLRRLRTLDWDSIYSDCIENQENSEEYKTILRSTLGTRGGGDIADLEQGYQLDYGDNLFTLPISKVKVIKQRNNIVNLNSIGLNFWSHLNLNPINGVKNYQMLMVSEITDTYLDCNSQFLSALVYNYRECNLGNISPLNISSEVRPDLEIISNGMVQVEVHGGSHDDYYRQVNKKLKSLAELIRLDLINKTHRFEFGRPLLLFFVNFDDSLNSLIKISKLCRNFQESLHRHQVPLVEVFNYVIPWSKIFKVRGSSKRLRHLSDQMLSKISMNLYNQCPDMQHQIHPSIKLKSSYSQVVKDSPSKIDFRLLGGAKDNSGSTGFNGEVFLHLACERSIDRNWFVAAWSDPLGQVAYMKSWFCSPSFKSSASSGSGYHDLSKICDEIWEISDELFKKLNQNIIREMSGFGGRKFLVLTRINSIIPDEELVHWKRLSSKNKEISLIVLSVNSKPKVLFKMDDVESPNEVEGDFQAPSEQSIPSVPIDIESAGSTMKTEPDFFKNFSIPESTNSSPNAANMVMATSPYTGSGMNFHSPQQFTNAPNNFLSPQDFFTGSSSTINNANSGELNNNFFGSQNNIVSDTRINNNSLVLTDPRDTITAVLPKVPLPSFNSPSRLGMKIGFLIKAVNNEYLVYEVNLLSCSNYWNLNSIMQIILKQYKKLITLNFLLGIRERSTSIQDEEGYEGLIPWHIAAVTRQLQYLVHIEVEE
ncbi:mediator of RNA polymerase II transcription subunit 13 [[Candida] railenensis]|uniref:Mediator of RNA polymerase II transcription subunit 13 n=1 Tax=[Candida] railenensis TaxID=45579 RepID=A0A9P0QTS1_9ASCO|nr:mediator of RNA polymerase II transcription subunit 13 [[Candida] railenensis]